VALSGTETACIRVTAADFREEHGGGGYGRRNKSSPRESSLFANADFSNNFVNRNKYNMITFVPRFFGR